MNTIPNEQTTEPIHEGTGATATASRQRGKWDDQGRVQSNSSMVRRSLSNPFFSIRPFSRRRREDEKGNGSQPQTPTTTSSADHARKVSIDHTVLSRDDSSRHNTSQDFSRSFDGGNVEVLHHPNNFNGGLAAAPAPTKSASEPSFLCYQECAPAPVVGAPGYYHHHQVQAPYAPPAAPPAPAAGFAHPAQQPPPATKAADDPALRARIEAIRIQQQLLGQNHPDVIFALSGLAKLHQRRGNHEEAMDILRESQMRSTILARESADLMSARQSHQGLGGHLVAVPTEISFSPQG